MSRPRRAPSAATVMSAMALFVSLGGVGYAAATIGSAQIKDNSIQGKDIKNATIRTGDIANGTIRATDIAKKERSKLGATGPQGPAGAAGAAGGQGPAGPAGRSALEPLRSGETIRGTFAMQGDGLALWTGVTFPVPAPEPVDSYHVVIANNDTVGNIACAGTKEAPTAPPGFVCIYPHQAVNTSTGAGYGAFCACGDPTVTGDGSRYGFYVQVTRANAGFVSSAGTWAYTAP